MCSGFEPRAPGWKAQTNPLSYCGAPRKKFLFELLLAPVTRLIYLGADFVVHSSSTKVLHVWVVLVQRPKSCPGPTNVDDITYSINFEIAIQTSGGGGQVVSVLAFFRRSEFESRRRLQFFLKKMCLKRTKINKKRPRLALFKKTSKHSVKT